MSNKNFVPVHPQTLHWARKDSGLTLEMSAIKSRIRTARLFAFETGMAHITLPQAKKLAKIYGVSVVFLYLKKPPRGHITDNIIDYRIKNYKITGDKNARDII